MSFHSRLAVLVAFVVAGALATAPLPEDWARGFNVFQMQKGAFANNTTLPLIQKAVTTFGGDFVALAFMYRQSNTTSSDVSPGEDTPSILELKRMIEAIHSLKKAVLLKPMLVSGDGSTWELINPANPEEWFAAYSRIIVTLAALAESQSVKYLSIGLELKQVSTNTAYLPFWEKLIIDVRAIYSGHVTYASDPFTNETQMIPFWTQLDSVGIDLYVPYVISRSPDANLTPTRDEMVQVFQYILSMKVMQWYASSDAKKAGLKLFIIESGYPSSNRGLQSPWVLPPRSLGCVGIDLPNMTAQAAAFDVMFQQLLRTPTAFMGCTLFWVAIAGAADYSYPGEPNGPLYECGWNPIGKQETIDVLRAAFKR